MARTNALDWLALLLVIVGGINWGLVGLFNFDVVSYLFGPASTVSKALYTLIGLSAVYAIFTSMKVAETSRYRVA